LTKKAVKWVKQASRTAAARKYAPSRRIPPATPPEDKCSRFPLSPTDSQVGGVEGIYDRHDYIDERREALTKWAAFLDCCETGKDWNVIQLRGKKKTA